jgi:hypothetical protein
MARIVELYPCSQLHVRKDGDNGLSSDTGKCARGRPIVGDNGQVSDDMVRCAKYNLSDCRITRIIKGGYHVQ